MDHDAEYDRCTDDAMSDAKDAALGIGPHAPDCATCGQIARVTCDSCDEPACAGDCLVGGYCRKCDPKSHAVAARSLALGTWDRRIGVE